MTTFIKNILDITDQYDLIISDVFGVIHDGQKRLPNVISFYSHIADKVALLTNDGRCTDTVQSHLKSFDFEKEKHYKDIFTSGYFLNQFYLNNSLKNPKCYILDEYLTPSIASVNLVTSIPGLEVVDNIEEAQFCFVAGVSKLTLDQMNDNPELIKTLEKLLSKQCKLLCPNPDKLVVYGDAGLIPLAGYIADMFAEIGGEVISFGKPAKYPYEFILNKYNPSKALMIGDTIDTDIKGAIDVGIDSLLIGTGVTKHSWQPSLDITSFNDWLTNQSLQPTWYIDQF